MKTYASGLDTSGRVGIGIDQSYTGFAIAAVQPSGYEITVYTGEGKGVNRLRDIRDHLEAYMVHYESAYGIKDIAMEGYAPGSKFGREMAGELGGMVKMTLFDTTPVHYPLIVTPSSLKKYVTGKGTVAKNQILLGVFKKWGVDLDNDNAADAYGLARIAYGMADHQYERDVLGSLHRETA